MFRMRKSKICKIKRYFSPTLVKKVTILYLFIIIIPAVIFMSYLYNMSKRNVYEHFYSERAKIEKEILNSFESDYSRYDYMAKLVRSDEIIKNLLQPGLLKDGEKVEYILRYTDSMFNHSLRIDPFIEEVCIYYTKKQLFDVEHSFYDVAWIKDEPWYHTLMDDPYYDNSRWMFHVTHKRSDRTTTSVFLKLYDNYYSELYGILEIQLHTERLFGHHLQSFEENGFSFRIRDAEGQSIYTGGQQTGVSSEVSQQLNLETLGCTIEILADTQASESQLLQIKNGIILVVCSGAVVLLLISYVLTQKIFIRLNRVLFAVKRVQMGDFDFQLGMKTGDEVGELAQSIDIMIYKIRDLIEQNYKTQLAEKEAQLKFLQAQINPHFLYNTLEVIKMQAELKNQLEISDSISALGKVMRRALSGHLYDIIPLKEEIAYLESYFLLQKLIYMDRLTFVLDIPDTVKARLHTLNINKMLLQPLIENAIVHGMGTHKAITVTVGFRIDAQKLVARVHNTGNIIDPSTRARLIQELAQPENVAFRDVKGNGVGLINVSQRLRYIYGAEYGLTINSCAERGTEVSFCIPLEETEDV